MRLAEMHGPGAPAGTVHSADDLMAVLENRFERELGAIDTASGGTAMTRDRTVDCPLSTDLPTTDDATETDSDQLGGSCRTDRVRSGEVLRTLAPPSTGRAI